MQWRLKQTLAVALVTAACVMAGAVQAEAQTHTVATSFDELRGVLTQPAVVEVRRTDGTRLTGIAQAVEAGRLRLSVAGQLLDINEREVLRVDTKRRDSGLNGLLIGAAAGGLLGLIPDYYDDCEECHDSLYGSIAVGAGVGWR